MMQIVTRGWIEKLLQDELFDPRVLRQVPGWSPVADALEALRRHGYDLKRWSERLADQKRAHLESEHDRLSTDLAGVVADATRRLQAMGIPSREASSLGALTEAYGRLLDVVEATDRETRLLGPSGSDAAKADLEAQGMVHAESDPPGLRDHAREIRDRLREAELLTTEIVRIDQAIDAIDPYDLDEGDAVMYRGPLAEYPVSMPDTGPSRPMLDPQVAATLQQVGIKFETELTGAEETPLIGWGRDRA